ncbi:conserved exported protein of unknown function [Burkholderia multivorans]
MKLAKSIVLLTFVGAAASVTGCATITGGTTQNVSVKTQKDAIDVVGAECVLSNSRGTYNVTTPGKANVHRAEDELSVQCTKDGESNAVTTGKPATRKGAYYAGNLIMFGIVGGGLIAGPIDRATGAKYAYPEDITVSFGKSVAPQSPSDAQEGIALQESKAQTISGVKE